MKKAAVILSGCGVMDGSEIHEATLTVYFLVKAGAEVHFFAPDRPQADVVNHAEGKAVSEKRNCIAEAARIARGKIKPLSGLNPDSFDCILMPGGMGAVKNLCDYAAQGVNCSIDPDLARVLRAAHQKGKAIGCICIAPVTVARAFKGTAVKPRLTTGTDKDTLDAIRVFGGEPFSASSRDIVVDEKNKIVSTPAYMLARDIAELAVGIEKLVDKILAM